MVKTVKLWVGDKLMVENEYIGDITEEEAIKDAKSDYMKLKEKQEKDQEQIEVELKRMYALKDLVIDKLFAFTCLIKKDNDLNNIKFACDFYNDLSDIMSHAIKVVKID